MSPQAWNTQTGALRASIVVIHGNRSSLVMPITSCQKMLHFVILKAGCGFWNHSSSSSSVLGCFQCSFGLISALQKWVFKLSLQHFWSWLIVFYLATSQPHKCYKDNLWLAMVPLPLAQLSEHALLQRQPLVGHGTSSPCSVLSIWSVLEDTDLPYRWHDQPMCSRHFCSIASVVVVPALSRTSVTLSCHRIPMMGCHWNCSNFLLCLPVRWLRGSGDRQI